MAEPPKQQPSQAQKPGAAGFKLKLTQQQTQNLAVIGVVVAVAIFGYVKYLFQPALKEYKEKTAVLEQKKKDLNDARSMVAKYDEFLKRASEISSRTDFINRRLPQESNISDTIREMTKKATESNINIINFEPGKDVVKGEYRETEIKVRFATTYSDLGDFLTKLGYIERLTTPSYLSVKTKPPTANKTLRENIDVEMAVKIYSFI